MNKILADSGLFSSSNQPLSFVPQGTVEALSRCDINEAPRSSEDARTLYFSVFPPPPFLSFDGTGKVIISRQTKVTRARSSSSLIDHTACISKNNSRRISPELLFTFQLIDRHRSFRTSNYFREPQCDKRERAS